MLSAFLWVPIWTMWFSARNSKNRHFYTFYPPFWWTFGKKCLTLPCFLVTMNPKRKRTGLKIGTIGIAFMCVFLCGMMYISFRPDTLKMFHWFKVFGLLDYLEELQHNPARVPSWMLYNLPDGIWLFAYSILIGCFWNFKIKDCWMFILVMPFICIPHEFLQGLGIMHYTYNA